MTDLQRFEAQCHAAGIWRAGDRIRDITEHVVETHPTHLREYHASFISFPDSKARVTHHRENNDLAIALTDMAREARWLGWDRALTRLRKRPQYRLFTEWWKERVAA